MTAPAMPATTPRVPDVFDRLGESLAERVNPIVLKEVRQALRARGFWVFFSLMLAACVAISLLAVVMSEPWSSSGRAYFTAYAVCLGLVEFFVIPYSAYRSMAREQEEETWVLLTLTGLGPHRILRGKMASSVLYGILHMSAVAPFLLFSYYLNGIDLPSILVTTIATVIWQLFLTSVGVSMATLASSKLFRAALHFAVLGGLFVGTWMGMAAVFGAVEGIREIVGHRTLLIGAIGVVFTFASWAVLLYESAAARISLTTESYARGPRLAALAQLLGSMGIWSWLAIESRDEAWVPAAAIIITVQLWLAGLFLASDYDGMARALWLKRGRVSLLEPGALRGFRFVMLLLVLVLLVCTGLALALHPVPRVIDATLGAPAYAVLYLAAPVVLARLLHANPVDVPRNVRIAGVLIFVLGSTASPFAALVMGRSPTESAWNVLNPLFGMAALLRAESHAFAHLLVLWCGALGLAFVAHGMLSSKDSPSEARSSQ